MEYSEKNGRKSPYPPYDYSTKFYTDPFNSIGLDCGYEDQEVSEELADNKDTEALDEPIESWGWINNAD